MNDFVLRELQNGDLSKVIIKREYPYCIEHGAMNKISSNGWWRCMSIAWIGKHDKIFENICRAGAIYE